MTGTRKFVILVLSMAIMTILGACAEGIQTDRQMAHNRANAYLVQNPDTDPNIAAAIRGLNLVKGMTPAHVTAAWGKPIRVQTFSNAPSVTWHFNCDYPHMCRGGGARGRRRPEDTINSFAHFVDGKLSQWRM